MRLARIRDSVFIAGLVLGLGAALVQAYFKVIPPTAYGVCMAGHPKDLFNWLADHLLGTDWGYTMASSSAPLLTVVGVVAGAALASRLHGEFQFRPARQPLLFFISGFLMINFALMLAGCPIRIVLQIAYGSLFGLAGLVMIVAGVAVGIWLIRSAARRGA